MTAAGWESKGAALLAAADALAERDPKLAVRNARLATLAFKRAAIMRRAAEPKRIAMYYETVRP